MEYEENAKGTSEMKPIVFRPLVFVLTLAFLSGPFHPVSIFGPVAARAQSEMPLDGDNERYQMRRDGDYFVRLDRKSGEMSLCLRSQEKLVCRVSADERAALEQELSDLQERLAALENGNAERQEKPKQQREKKPDKKTFSELDRELDQFMDYSSKVLRKFFTVMKDMKEEFSRQE